MESFDDDFKFLQARDPSIVSGILATGKVKKNVCCKKLLPLLETACTDLESSKEVNDEKHYQVFLRLKVNNSGNKKKLYTIKEENTFICHIPEGSLCTRNARFGDEVVKNYTFDKIFDENVHQATIFNECVKPQILNFINGTNSTLFTYGASGSGKTYTILGNAAAPGIIPRALEYLFRTLPKTKELPSLRPTQNGGVESLDQSSYNLELEYMNKLLNHSKIGHERSIHGQTYKTMQLRMSTEKVASLPKNKNVIFSVWVSFLEIYNEQIFDLLTNDPDRGKKRRVLKIGHDSKNGAFVRDLTILNVGRGQDAYELLQYGKQNLKYAATSLNAHSSRSHCIFTIRLVQSDMKGEHVRVSRFNFCDLAGSERAKDTHNLGDRLKESNNINTSLHVLGRCLKALLDRQNKIASKVDDKFVIPFRESKLTQLFKQALAGGECVTMIVNINPSLEMFDTSQHVLNFSAIAKSIVVIPLEKPKKKSRFSQYLERCSNLPPMPDISISTSLENETNTVSSDRLRNIFLLHQLELEQKAQEVREEVCLAYQAILSETNAKWEKRTKEKEENLNAGYKWQLEHNDNMWKLHVEHLKKQLEKLNDDSDDDVVEDYEANIVHLQDRLAQAKLAYTNDIEKLRSEMETLTETKDELKIQVKENEELVASAAIDYRELEKENKQLLTNLYEQTEEITELRAQLQEYLHLEKRDKVMINVLKTEILNKTF